MDERADDEQVSPRVDAPDAPDTPDTPGTGHTGLTRVEIGDLVPEPATDWCRHEVRRLIAGHLLATAAIVAGVVIGLARRSGIGWAPAVGLGVLAGVTTAAARVAAALLTAPLGLRYVRRYITAPPEYRTTCDPTVTAVPVTPDAPVAIDPTSLPDVWDLEPLDAATLDAAVAQDLVDAGTLHDRPFHDRLLDEPTTGHSSAAADEAARALGELGLWPVAAVRTEGHPSSVVALFSDGDRIVAAVDRTRGSITLLTELVGFRVLVTGTLLVPPTDDLVVNVVDDDSPSALVVSHRRLVYSAVRSRAMASDPVGLFKLAQQRELEAYRQLGPFWGAMLDLRCRPRSVRLLSAPSAPDVLLFTGNRLFRQTS